MFRAVIDKYGLTYSRTSRLKTIFRLLWNAILYMKWNVTKRLQGIHSPVVHYYAVCWNEERMLPFMFYHYGSLVERFFIFDNGSTDSSREIINRHPKAELIPFQTKGFDDIAHMRIKNECWKKSRGKADYVIVCDIDEFTYLSQPMSFFKELQEQNISIPLSIGYNMVAEEFPKYSKTPSLISAVNRGVISNDYSKCLFFDPYKIVDINYEPGAHICHPTGMVRYSKYPLYRVLHYKNLGYEYVIDRSKEYRLRMSEENIKNNYAIQYYESDNEIINKVNDMLNNALKVI